MTIHSDIRIHTACERAGFVAVGMGADYVRSGFESWDDFRAFFDTMYDGERTAQLDELADPEKDMPTGIGTADMRVAIQKFAPAPGRLHEYVADPRFGACRDETPEARDALTSATRPEFSQALAHYIRLTNCQDMSLILAVGPVHTFLRHDTAALLTVFSKHDVSETHVRVCADFALSAGASPEYLRRLPFETEVAKKHGMGGYKPGDIAIIEKAGVPVKYAKSLVACHLGGVGSQAEKLIRVYQMGVPAAYLMAVNNSMLRNVDLIERLDLDTVLAAYQDGVPVEYLVA